MRDVPFWRRAVMAHLLTDEAFALTVGHFRRVGRTDERGYWIAAIASTFIPWNLATLAGAVLGAQIPDPARFGIDIIFPAAMIGLAVGLVTGRRELVAAIVGAGVGVVVALLTGPSIGIVAGGIVGPFVGLLVPATLARETAPLGTPASADRYAMPGTVIGRRVGPRADPVDGPPPPAGTVRSGRAMSTDLVLLAVLMFAVTYPTRALGLLTPGMERLPKVALDYLQLVGPAVLTAIAAVNVVGGDRRRGHAVVPHRDRVAGRAAVHGRHRVAQEPAVRAGRGRGARGDRAGDRPGGAAGLIRAEA